MLCHLRVIPLGPGLHCSPLNHCDVKISKVTRKHMMYDMVRVERLERKYEKRNNASPFQERQTVKVSKPDCPMEQR